MKGFALMLLIGTVVKPLITAVAATRAMLGLLAGFRWFSNPRFMGANHSRGAASFLQIDYMGRIKLWFTISGVVLLIGLVLTGSARPEPRHRLQGRRADRVHDGQAGLDLRCAQPDGGSRPRRRRRTGPWHGVERRQRFQGLPGQKLKKLDPTDQTNVTNSLKDNVKAEGVITRNVSSSFGKQIAKSAIIAILFSLLVITLYITIHFRGVAFAIPVILAMIHDAFSSRSVCTR